MSDLDKKLKDILKQPQQNSVGATVMTFITDKAVEQIKQAFIDEGWVHIPQAEMVERWERGKPTEYRINGKVMMTGQEWYEKFEKETQGMIFQFCHKHDGDKYVKNAVHELLDAARRASGISEEES